MLSSALVNIFVSDMKKDLLTGAEWGYVLSVLGATISKLKTLVTNEEVYLEAMASSDMTTQVKKRIQDRFFIEQVCGISFCNVISCCVGRHKCDS